MSIATPNMRADTGRQTAIGLALAALITATWLAVHIYAVWVLDVAAQPVLAVALFALQTWLSVGLFIVSHDCMHGSLAPFRPAVNLVVGSLMLRLYMGFSYRRMIAKHHAHHRFAGTERDPDFDPDHPSNGVAWYFTFMRRYLDWYVFWVTGALVTGYLVALYAHGGAERAMHILFWAGPSLLASMQLFYFGTFRPHRHEEEHEGEHGHGGFADRHNSRSNDYPVWASLLTCFHFGYHHEHHDNPHVPWWRLPAARAAALQTTSAAPAARASALSVAPASNAAPMPAPARTEEITA